MSNLFLEVAKMREFSIDMQVSGTYNESLYELETVEEALAEWNLMYPDEYKDTKYVEEPILIESVHIDNINDWRIYGKHD
jgi:hypothetical protein